MNDTPRLLVLNPTCLDVIDEHRAWVQSQGVELLADQSNRTAQLDELTSLLKKSDAVILPSALRAFPMAEQMAACPRLRVCSIAASGFEWLDVSAATNSGIVVCFAPGGQGAEVVAELAIGLMLSVARQIPFHNAKLCRGDETRGMGTSLFGKTLGIIGLGSIGREVALRAAGMKMGIVAFDPLPDRMFADFHDIKLVSLEQLLERSDFVSLHVRLGDDTRRMLGARELRLMKPSAYLINTARGELVDEAALVEAIVQQRMAGAGLDDPPGAAAKKLLGLPNVVFTPHIGNRAIEGVHGVLRTALEGAIQALRGERPRFLVNPQVYEQRVRGESR
jgi:D-3-phosphoglycerate dehydrogenase